MFFSCSQTIDKDFVVSLTVDNCRTEDSGNYTVRVFSDSGEISSSTVVNVHSSGPTFSQPVSDVSAIFGQSATFDTSVTGLPRPQIRWYRDEEEILESEKYRISNLDDNCHASLTISNVSAEDLLHLYTCRAVSVFGEARTSAKILVEGWFVFLCFLLLTVFKPLLISGICRNTLRQNFYDSFSPCVF